MSGWSASGEVFRFKKFSVEQAGVTWKVGTDGVLLGAWADVSGCQRILDAGTGTGLLALMAAQRNAGAMITAIEIDVNTAQTAAMNFANSPWSDRLQVLNSDIRCLEELESDSFDFIISNPPFYPHGIENDRPQRQLARAGEGFSAFNLPAISDRLLRDQGCIATIAPFDSLEEVFVLYRRLGYFPARRCDVRHDVTKPFSRTLLEFSKAENDTEHTILTLHEGGVPGEGHRFLLEPYRDVV